MPAPYPNSARGLSKPVLYGLIALFTLIVIGGLFYIFTLSQKAKTNRETQQEQQFQAPQTAEKRQVLKIRLSDEAGKSVEVSLNGEVSSFNERGEREKTARQGFALTDSLLNRVNEFLDSDQGTFIFKGSGRYTLRVETSQGTRTITLIGNEQASQSDEGADDLLDLIEDIEETTDSTLNPTPTPTPAPTIPPGSSPTPTPITGASPTPTSNPFASPTPTPSPGEEASVPEYLLADPFSCDDYNVSRPTLISNVICGIKK